MKRKYVQCNLQQWNAALELAANFHVERMYITELEDTHEETLSGFAIASRQSEAAEQKHLYLMRVEFNYETEVLEPTHIIGKIQVGTAEDMTDLLNGLGNISVNQWFRLCADVMQVAAIPLKPFFHDMLTH